jgi:hypothetical protein
MNAQETLQKIHQVGIIPVIRAASAEEAFLAVEAMEEGGIHAVEITMTVPGAIEVIRKVCEVFGKRTCRRWYGDEFCAGGGMFRGWSGIPGQPRNFHCSSASRACQGQAGHPRRADAFRSYDCVG